MIQHNSRAQRELLAERANDLIEGYEKRGNLSHEEFREFEHVTKALGALDRAEGRETRIKPGDVAALREYLTSPLDPDSHRIGRDDVNHRSSAIRGEHGAGVGEDGASLLDDALAGWAKTQTGEPITDSLYRSCADYGVSPHSSVFEVRFNPTRPRMAKEYLSRHQHVEKRSLGVMTDPTGGYSVAPGFVSSLERALLDFSGILQVAEMMRTERGEDMAWPTTDDTGNEGALLGEGATVTEQDIAIAQIIFRSYKLTSKMIKVSSELLQDNSVSLASALGAILGERIGRTVNRFCTLGAGASEPTGIVTASTLGKTAASQTAIAFDELIDLVHSVDAAYRTSDGTTGFMLHDSIGAYIRKLKDGDGNYIWQSNNQAGMPPMLLGWPVYFNSHMASSLATGNKTVLFGKLSKYKVRFAGGLRMRRLSERYAENDQEAFLAFQRIDGALLDAGTHPVKYLQQA